MSSDETLHLLFLPMIVCIAEKPSVAQDIAKVLGATKKCDGYFEGNGYQVTWTFGHLCCLKSPEEYDRVLTLLLKFYNRHFGLLVG